MITNLVLLYPVVLLAIIVIAGLYLLESRRDQAFAAKLFLAVSPIQLFVLYCANQAIPFVPRETDARYYYEFSQRDIPAISGYFDVNATKAALRDFEGVPYTHVLTIVHQFVGDSLLGRKLLNWAFLWPTVFAWHWIALRVLGRRGAHLTAASIALMPTLWYFFLILYRDMLTLCFQSVFLVAALRLWEFPARRKGNDLAMVIISTLTLSFLRPVLLYANLLILLAMLALSAKKSFGGGGVIKRAGSLAVAAAIVLTVFGVSGYFSEALGAKASLGAIAVQIAYSHQSPSVSAGGTWLGRAIVMAPLYVCSELAAGSNSLKIWDPDSLGGMMNMAWSVLFAPFVCVSLVHLLNRSILRMRLPGTRKRLPAAHGSAIPPERTPATPFRRMCFASVLAYVALWYVVCLLSWDWTRWRLPAVPALTLLAVWSWQRLSPGGRILTLAVWWCVLFGYRVAVGSALG